jgi:hypothetical protein
MSSRWLLVSLILAACCTITGSAEEREKLYLAPLNVHPKPIAQDKSVKYDYDIVYVRAPRRGDKERSAWTEIVHPAIMDPGADLMLLHPDGREEVLVKAGADDSVTDPFVSFDGEWVFYAHIRGLKGTSQHGQPPFGGADIYKLHVKSRKIVQLTHQEFTPNTGAANWGKDYRTPRTGQAYLTYGVLNLNPCPLPGGKVIFVSNRNAFLPPKHAMPCLQLFVMDDDGKNVEQIGYLNIGMALHPVVLVDGRVMFSSLEAQGLRSGILWGLWQIHPDGTNWGPIISAFDTGGAPNAFHFQTQLSDGSIIAEEYYNQNNSGFGAYFKLPPYPLASFPLTPPSPPAGGEGRVRGTPQAEESGQTLNWQAGFGPAYLNDPRNTPLRFGRHDNGKGMYYRLPFSPFGIESFTPFANNGEGPANPSVIGDPKSLAVGKFTHPSGAPDNHLLTVWSPGPANHQYSYPPEIDGGLYLIKSGRPIDEPGQMLLIKNDPNYNEQWPRALVPYERIYGVKEPRRLTALANDGKLPRRVHVARFGLLNAQPVGGPNTWASQLPEGTPFGLIGTSSLYKRESYPNGVVPPRSVTATFAGGRDPNGYAGQGPFNTSENGPSLNWFNQGAEAGRYTNDDIHAIRILITEPTTDRNRGNYPRDGKLFYSHSMERLRILGELPVRKFPALAPTAFSFDHGAGGQPLDPDGNPDTSFLAKIPADTAFTFQTIDKHGMVLNMAQTWHQLRPGEVRNNCGGCHAHSQKPTEFRHTAAAAKDYEIFDLTRRTPLVTTRALDESKQKWDEHNETGLRYENGIKNVEYFRDIKPILDRSCAACHTGKAAKPAGNLVLDDDKPISVSYVGALPGTYFRLAMDGEAKFGYKPLIHSGHWRNENASRYIRRLQSRRSLLAWKVLGRRTDGWSNDDFPSETIPGDPNSLHWKGKPVPNTPANVENADLDYNGKQMPPPEAVAGTYVGPDGKKIKVAGLTSEDKLTMVRWIDLGCPIDLDYDPAHPERRGYGWMAHDNRPTLTLTYPRAGANPELNRILVGMHDYDSGLDQASFQAIADFAVNGVAAGQNLAPHFKPTAQGVWELKLTKPIVNLAKGRILVSVRDRAGNTSRIARVFSAGMTAAARTRHVVEQTAGKLNELPIEEILTDRSSVLDECSTFRHERKDLLALLEHGDAGVRGLAIALLYASEDPQALPQIAALLDDKALLFPGPGTNYGGSGSVDNLLPSYLQSYREEAEPLTVDRLARAVIDAYLREAGEYTNPDQSLRKAFETYWAARKDRASCASWFGVQLARASQNFAPPTPNRLPKIKKLRRRIDRLPEPDRTLTLLKLHGDDRGGEALIAEGELIAACKQLGPERLLLLLGRKLSSADPDLQPARLPSHMDLFVLAHAGKLLRREDAKELLSGEQRLPSPSWAIAAADLDREHAAALLHAAFERFSKGGIFQTEDQLELALALWRLVGWPEADFLLNWFYAQKPTSASSDHRPRFLKGITRSPDQKKRQLMAKIIQDKRLETLDWQSLDELIQDVNPWAGKPIADGKVLPELPFSMEQYDRSPDQALRQYPKETKILRETFSLWRQKLRASIPDWKR